MHGSRWTWPGTVASALLAMAGACGGHAVTLTTCDGGVCPDSGGSSSGGSSGGSSGSSSGGAPFPFSGPSCSGPSFGTSCWGCVQDSCPTTESCLTTDCADYFGCFCACASGDTACQTACPQPDTSCETCAQNVTECQRQSCSSVCSSGSGAPTTICSTPQSCASGGTLVACSVTSGGLCSSQFYTVGSQTFTCAACGNCAVAEMAAAVACQ